MCLGIYMYLCNPELPISENSLTSKPSIMQVFQGCQCTGIQCFSDSLKFEALADRFSWTSSNCLVKSELIIYPNITIPSGIRAIQNRPPHTGIRRSGILTSKLLFVLGDLIHHTTNGFKVSQLFFFEKRVYTVLYKWLRLTIRRFIYIKHQTPWVFLKVKEKPIGKIQLKTPHKCVISRGYLCWISPLMPPDATIPYPNTRSRRLISVLCFHLLETWQQLLSVKLQLEQTRLQKQLRWFEP